MHSVRQTPCSWAAIILSWSSMLRARSCARSDIRPPPACGRFESEWKRALARWNSTPPVLYGPDLMGGLRSGGSWLHLTGLAEALLCHRSWAAGAPPGTVYNSGPKPLTRSPRPDPPFTAGPLKSLTSPGPLNQRSQFRVLVHPPLLSGAVSSVLSAASKAQVGAPAMMARRAPHRLREGGERIPLPNPPPQPLLAGTMPDPVGCFPRSW